MKLEVELKFKTADHGPIQRQLEAMSATWQDDLEQADTYFAHPCRDFSQTDEALRIRSVGPLHLMTYKGPKLDTATKTRREIELELGQGDAVEAGYFQLLEALGFRQVAQVRKRRRVATVPWMNQTIEVALDQVDQVGAFVELELIATDEQLDEARQSVLRLAEHFQLTDPIRKSYLELLLETQSL